MESENTRKNKGCVLGIERFPQVLHLIRAVVNMARLSANGTQLRNPQKILVTKQSRKMLLYLHVPGKTSLAQQISET